MPRIDHADERAIAPEQNPPNLKAITSIINPHFPFDSVRFGMRQPFENEGFNAFHAKVTGEPHG